MNKRILLIDDDKVLSKTTAKRLEKRGFEVVCCLKGEEGLALMIEEPSKFDIVLLDIKIPDLDGIEILNRVRKNHEKNLLPVIMVSSQDEQVDIVDALKKGANDYVTKPINIDILVARINTHLETKNLAMEFTKAKESGAIAAMIATYNHEINNPLAIAFGTIDSLHMKEKIDKKSFSRIEKALERIKDIVSKIDKLADKTDVSYENYTEKSKMIKVD